MKAPSRGTLTSNTQDIYVFQMYEQVPNLLQGALCFYLFGSTCEIDP